MTLCVHSVRDFSLVVLEAVIYVLCVLSDFSNKLMK